MNILSSMYTTENSRIILESQNKLNSKYRNLLLNQLSILQTPKTFENVSIHKVINK